MMSRKKNKNIILKAVWINLSFPNDCTWKSIQIFRKLDQNSRSYIYKGFQEKMQKKSKK